MYDAVARAPSLVGCRLAIQWSDIPLRAKTLRAISYLDKLKASYVADKLLEASETLQAVRVELSGDQRAERGPSDIFYQQQTPEPWI